MQADDEDVSSLMGALRADEVAITSLLVLERARIQTFNKLFEEVKASLYRWRKRSVGKEAFKRRIDHLTTVGVVVTEKTGKEQKIQLGRKATEVLQNSSFDLDEIRAAIEGRPSPGQVESALQRLKQLGQPKGLKLQAGEVEFWQHSMAAAFASNATRVSLRNRLLYQWSSTFGGMSLDWAHLVVELPHPEDSGKLLEETVEVEDVMKSLKSSRYLSDLRLSECKRMLEVLQRFEKRFDAWYPLLNLM